MSTPEHPATPPLTRKQMREIRNTGATPVITATPPSEDAAPAPAPDEPAPSVPASAAPLPRPAEPPVIPPPPVADSAVDLGVSPLTRRQARQQEKIRTASVPVITPEVVAAHAAASGSVPSFAAPAAPAPAAEPQRSPFAVPEDADAPVSTDSGVDSLFGLPRTQGEAPEAGEPADSSIWARPVEAAPQPAPTEAEATPVPQPAAAGTPEQTDDASIRDVFGTGVAGTPAEEKRDQPKAVVSPLLGAGLLGSDPAPSAPVAAPELPASFDQLLSRSTGAISVPNALIVSQAPEVSPLVGPVTATGEVLVTGTFNLPEGLGSTGHAKGTADGKEIDATLVDGELPSHSSPTPIAASAAVSTVKMPGEVIKPPTPEKGSRLMMSLAITAGVLAIALVGVLILAFATGAL